MGETQMPPISLLIVLAVMALVGFCLVSIIKEPVLLAVILLILVCASFFIGLGNNSIAVSDQRKAFKDVERQIDAIELFKESDLMPERKKT